MIESLEHRKLFSATLTNGVLEVVGTDDADRILLRSVDIGKRMVVGTFLQVIVNGVRQNFSWDDVKEIRVASLGGDDAIRNEAYSAMLTKITHEVDGGGDTMRYFGSPPVRLDGGAGNDAITGGPANDTIRGGDGDDTLFGGEGRDVLRGGDGDDFLYDTGTRDVLRGEAGKDRFQLTRGRARIDLDRDDATLTLRVPVAEVFDLAGSPFLIATLPGVSGDVVFRAAGLFPS